MSHYVVSQMSSGTSAPADNTSIAIIKYMLFTGGIPHIPSPACIAHGADGFVVCVYGMTLYATVLILNISGYRTVFTRSNQLSCFYYKIFCLFCQDASVYFFTQSSGLSSFPGNIFLFIRKNEKHVVFWKRKATPRFILYTKNVSG